MREVKLPSGALLKVSPAPFADAKALYQAILREFRGVPITTGNDVGEIVKNAFCSGFASPEIDACLWKCMERCTYNGQKISSGAGGRDDVCTFEPVEARDDFAKVCVEVTKENVGPFVKSLSADFEAAVSTLVGFQKSKPSTTPS